MERKIAEQSSLVASEGSAQKYYKAVRPNGFDFHSGTVNYAGHLGQWLPEKESRPEPECCSSDVYHASTSAADTLIGGSWPCRLFEVEGEAVAEEENKRGFYTLKVVREVEAWRALGSNGEAVAALIEKAKTIAEGQAEALHAAWDAAWDAARYAARCAAWRAAEDAAWYAARCAAWYAARDAAEDAAGDAARCAAWRAAGDAAWYAAGALVVKDLISEEQFNVLYDPWASVMEQ